MSPILGIIASSLRASNNSYESIATASGTGSAATITFSSIPSTYKHLQIRFIAKDTENLGSANTNPLSLTANSITSYVYHRLLGDGTSASADWSGGASSVLSYNNAIPTSFSTQSDILGVGIIDILDYSSTTKNKTVRAFLGCNANSTSTVYKIQFNSGLILSTAAISSLTLGTQAGGNLTTTSRFALYGIKG